MKVITENNNFAQSVISDLGLNINSIDFNNWSVKNIVKFMNSIDIGVVPNNKILENKFDDFNNGLYFSDYTLRFKNKSNPGRAFVYIQFGIPVIADLTPSMHLCILMRSVDTLQTTKSLIFMLLENLVASLKELKKLKML